MEKPNQPQEHLGLAIKYRPECLADVLGQEVLTTTLTNMIKLGKMAKAYVLVGSRGTGKTTTARILAKIFNCPERAPGSVEPCLKCSSCLAIKTGCHPDVLEIDAASNTSVDAVRNVIELAQTVPTNGRMRVFIFDEFHMLSTSAFNALLHTIEEPPAHAKFIFATTEVQKIPETVLSRCLRFDLVRVDDQVITTHLQKIAKLENFNCEDGALDLLAEAASGSLRDALFLLEHAALLGGGEEVTYATVESLTGRISTKSWKLVLAALQAKQTTNLLRLIKDLTSRHGDLNLLIYSLVRFLHHQHVKALISGKDAEEKYLFQLLEVLAKARTFLHDSPYPREAVEMIFIRLLMVGANPAVEAAVTASPQTKEPSLF